MLAYIRGILESKMKNFVVIDVGGLGYKVLMSEAAIDKLGKIGEKVKVYTYYRVMENDISIFGFNTNEELLMFELLISVGGIGAKTALATLGVLEPSQFALAIISEDIQEITKIPGIGPKSAKRIILELKDKLKKNENITKTQSADIQNVVKADNKTEEATSALQVLGYNKKEIERAFVNIDKKELTVEEIIKKALIQLSK